MRSTREVWRDEIERRVPDCSCRLSGKMLHADDCLHLIALVQKYQPPGLRIEKRRGAERVVRRVLAP